jgi:hypothetical protein
MRKLNLDECSIHCGDDHLRASGAARRDSAYRENPRRIVGSSRRLGGKDCDRSGAEERRRVDLNLSTSVLTLDSTQEAVICVLLTIANRLSPV